MISCVNDDDSTSIYTWRTLRHCVDSFLSDVTVATR